MKIDAEKLSVADRQWGRTRAGSMGVSSVIPEERRSAVLDQSALLLADIRDHKRRIGIPVPPDEGTTVS